MKRAQIVGAFVVVLLLVLSISPVAHEIPADVTFQAFVKPEGGRLRLLVRVPLKAMRDVDFPRRGPGYLDLARAESALRDAAILWIGDSVELFEEDTRLASPPVIAVRVSLPSDTSFRTYGEALAHVTGRRLSDDTELYWDQGLLDVLFEYPIRSDRSNFSIHAAVARLGSRVITVLRFLPPGGVVRAFEFAGDPGIVRLDPRWHQAARGFVELGFFHILSGIDHLLFLVCLVIPFRRFRPLIVVVTSFTVAHTITLMASAFNVAPNTLWFPVLIETLIAMSIVYMGLENIVVYSRGPLHPAHDLAPLAGTPAPRAAPLMASLHPSSGITLPLQRRWLITFGFGLVHGFGFSFALRESLQFAGAHLMTSLVSFNVGVELGQLLVLILLIPILDVLFRFVVAERVGTIVLSALVVHTGWHWMVERADRLRQHRFQWPAFDALLLANAMRWLMLIVIVAGLAWLFFGVIRPFASRNVKEEA